MNLQYVEVKQQVIGAKLVRSGSDIYVSGESEVLKVVFFETIDLERVVEPSFFKERVRILDFLVSEGQYLNFIVILTEQKLFFFIL